jgi:hypothetical protein
MAAHHGTYPAEAPFGTGTGISRHELPFHRSPASTGPATSPVVNDPTARHEAAEVHDTADSPALWVMARCVLSVPSVRITLAVAAWTSPRPMTVPVTRTPATRVAIRHRLDFSTTASFVFAVHRAVFTPAASAITVGRET